MSKIINGGPAFPTENARQTGPSSWHEEGMTLRDYFAAKAMQGMCVGRSHTQLKGHSDGSAKVAYEIADAMLRAREAA